MIAPGADLKIYMATRPVDFRRGLDGLAAAVQERRAGAWRDNVQSLSHICRATRLPSGYLRGAEMDEKPEAKPMGQVIQIDEARISNCTRNGQGSGYSCCLL